ncbi:MAG: hypothetical protein PF481_01695 [Bacteroidales bacterium]|jgi:hypothetical protein|nr:hypothetical protein [Bacteroidales bacterium]
MKKRISILATLLFFIMHTINAQEINNEETTQNLSFSKTGISISTGINNSVGMFGVGLYHTLTENTIIELGAGFGSWGAIGSVQAQYYLPRATDLYIRGTFKRSGGGREVPIDLELSDMSTQEVRLNFYPVANGQITFGKSWIIANKHRFYFEGGYSYFFGTAEDKYRVVDDVEISNAAKNSLSFIIPGGLILAIGFTIGF